MSQPSEPRPGLAKVAKDAFGQAALFMVMLFGGAIAASCLISIPRMFWDDHHPMWHLPMFLLGIMVGVAILNIGIELATRPD